MNAYDKTCIKFQKTFYSNLTVVESIFSFGSFKKIFHPNSPVWFHSDFFYFRLVVFSCPNLIELSGFRISAVLFDFKLDRAINFPVLPVSSGAVAAKALIMAPVIICMFKDRSKQAL